MDVNHSLVIKSPHCNFSTNISGCDRPIKTRGDMWCLCCIMGRIEEKLVWISDGIDSMGGYH